MESSQTMVAYPTDSLYGDCTQYTVIHFSLKKNPEFTFFLFDTTPYKPLLCGFSRISHSTEEENGE